MLPRSRRSKRSSKPTEDKREKLGLHERLDEKDLLKIKQAFFAIENKCMNEPTLKELLQTITKYVFPDKEFAVMFLKMNTARNGMVTWDEFISFLILGFKEKEISTEFESLEAPISKEPRLLRSNHRHPVNRIKFCPMVKLNRTFDFVDGSYLTCSKDGVINYWTLDMEVERTCQSTCPDLNVQTTWVTDFVALPDVNVVCTSSTERDLRFYDTSARKFELRVIITSLESAGNCLYYYFSQSLEEESKVIVGDQSGSVRVILFSPKVRGPFKSKPGIPLLRYRYDDIVKGYAVGFRAVEFKNVHSDWVKQVAYYEPLHCVVSCASCPIAAVLMRDLTGTKTNSVFEIEKGATCFALSDSPHLMATGGLDCTVRIWNPFIPQRPSGIFIGHHTAIIALILQEGKKVFSMSTDKVIKIWDMGSQTCIQNYNDLPSELGEFSDITFFYNPDNRQILLGSVMIVILEFCPLLSGEHTDGSTHSRGVSEVLYNPLFKIIVTVGLDSYIIVWDPWLGRRMSVVKNAHTKLVQGEEIRLEITAACFDPCFKLLLTGATDGSLKIWDFNTGTCIRNMRIESDNEVAAVSWVGNRVFACGWNKHVTEFSEGGSSTASGGAGAAGKSWSTRHTEDILCCATRIPQTLVTATYNGEMIMWQLETGQPYKQFNVANPTERIKIQYKVEKERHKGGPKSSMVMRSFSGPSPQKRKSLLPIFMQTDDKQLAQARRAKKVSVIQMPEACVPLRGLAVHAMLFLNSRPMDPKVGTLFVALENGQIQAWSHHTSANFMGSFSVIHTAGDYVISMTSDSNNEYLLTGSCAGYVKTWLIKNYLVGENVPISMPKYRLIFPFLWKDLWEGRAKRANRGQKYPILLNSFKAHFMPVSGLDFINDNQTFVSCSADNTARLWTLNGRYLATLGTFKPWVNIPQDVPPGEDRVYTMPADLKRVISSTTLKVFSGGSVHKKRLPKKEEDKGVKLIREIDLTKAGIYGKRVEEPILGNYYHLPEKKTERHYFTLDTSFPYIPVYQHLIMPIDQPYVRPKTPDILKGKDKEKRKSTRTT